MSRKGAIISISTVVDRTLTVLDRILQVAGVALLITVAASVMWQVIARYITSAPSGWTSELASYAFVWLAMIGIALGVRRARHMVLDVWEYLPYRKWLVVLIDTVAALIVTAVLVALIVFGFEALGPAWRRTLPGLGISYGWVALAVPVGSAFALIFAIEAWWRTARAGRGEQPLEKRVLFDVDEPARVKGEI